MRLIIKELSRHAPFTACGAITGIIIMLIIIFGRISSHISQTIFYILHPLHVVLSALVTTSMYRRHRKDKIWTAILIGYTGSIGIATLSDAIIPYIGGVLFPSVTIRFHLPFIETEIMPVIGIKKWQVVNSAALIGIITGYFRPTTKIPHTGHVLLSTWASLFYFTAFGIAQWAPLLPVVFLFLFLAVWIPCCLSDIVYPLLFIREDKNSG
jgi:hypothetical protein